MPDGRVSTGRRWAAELARRWASRLEAPPTFAGLVGAAWLRELAARWSPAGTLPTIGTAAEAEAAAIMQRVRIRLAEETLAAAKEAAAEIEARRLKLAGVQRPPPEQWIIRPDSLLPLAISSAWQNWRASTFAAAWLRSARCMLASEKATAAAIAAESEALLAAAGGERGSAS